MEAFGRMELNKSQETDGRLLMSVYLSLFLFFFEMTGLGAFEVLTATVDIYTKVYIIRSGSKASPTTQLHIMQDPGPPSCTLNEFSAGCLVFCPVFIRDIVESALRLFQMK